MEFCPKCGGLMLPHQIKEGPILACTKCGYAMKAPENLEGYRLVKRQRVKGEVPMVEQEGPSTLPTARVQCPKCGNVGAEWWLKQTRSADEPTTRFYRCTRCKHVWREY